MLRYVPAASNSIRGVCKGLDQIPLERREPRQVENPSSSVPIEDLARRINKAFQHAARDALFVITHPMPFRGHKLNLRRAQIPEGRLFGIGMNSSTVEDTKGG